jgi:hypothetical protein
MVTYKRKVPSVSQHNPGGFALLTCDTDVTSRIDHLPLAMTLDAHASHSLANRGDDNP